MSKNKKILSVCGLVLATIVPNIGYSAGAIDVAIVGEPATLDPMMSTKDVVGTVTQHFYETLFTFDKNWAPSPLLAESMPEVSADGKTYTIKIRQGIKFHDGSTLDSQDVVASLNRWLKIASRGKTAAAKVDAVTAPDANTIVISLNQPYAPLLPLLSMNNSAAVIVPQEIIGAEGLTAVVGTGPYRIKEHKADQYIQLVKYKGYQSRDEAPNGTAGGRTQVLDEIRFIPVGDGNTRLEGLLSGEYDFASSIAAEGLPRLEKSKTAEPLVMEDYGWPMFANNMKDGLMTSLNIRKAVQAALNTDDMLYAAFGNDSFFGVDGSLYPKGHIWNTQAGNDQYNVHDPKKAAEYLKAANYDGTPLRILTSHQFEFHFKMAEVAKINLESAGFKVKLDVVDWATLGERRNNPKLWDIYITHSPFIPEPSLNSVLNADSRLGWVNSKKEALLSEFSAQADITKRVELFEKLQQVYADDAPFQKIGNFNDLRGKSKNLQGVPKTPWPFFWNASEN